MHHKVPPGEKRTPLVDQKASAKGTQRGARHEQLTRYMSAVSPPWVSHASHSEDGSS